MILSVADEVAVDDGTYHGVCTPLHLAQAHGAHMVDFHKSGDKISKNAS